MNHATAGGTMPPAVSVFLASGASRHDGTIVQDYEYVAGSGDLDDCHGRRCVTPDFPEGTCAYFLTAYWPVILRAFRGTPVSLRGR